LAPGSTAAGRLHGEIVIGHRILTDLMREQPDFPQGLSTRLQHILIAHHGEREKGSPAVPMTREAIIVHYCDDMTARIAAFDEAEADTRRGERWTAYSRMHETPLFVDEAPADGQDGVVAEPAASSRDDRPGAGPSQAASPADDPLAAQPDERGSAPDQDEPQTLLDL